QYFKKNLQLSGVSDLVKAKTHYGLGTDFRKIRELASAKKHYLFALKFYIEVNDFQNQALIYCNLGRIEVELGNLNEGYDFFQKSLKMCSKDNHNLLMHLHLNIAFYYDYQLDFTQVENNLKLAYSNIKEINDKTNLFDILCSLAINSMKIRDLGKAKEYYRESMVLAENLGFNQGILLCYAGFGTISYLEGKFEEAIGLLQKANKIAEQLNEKLDLLQTYYQLGNVYTALGNFKQSEINYLQAKKITDEIKDSVVFILPNLYTSIAQMYLENKQFKKVKPFLSEAVLMWEKLDVMCGKCEAMLTQTMLFRNQKEFEKAKNSCQTGMSFCNKNLEGCNNGKNFIIEKCLVDFELNQTEKEINELFALRENKNFEEFVSTINYYLLDIYAKKKLPFPHKPKVSLEELRVKTIEELEKQYKTNPKFSFKQKLNFLKTLNFKNSETYLDLVRSLANLINPETTINEFLNFLQNETEANACQIILKKKNGFEICVVSPDLKPDELQFSKTILNKTINLKKPILIQNALEDTDLKENKSLKGKIFLSVIAVSFEIDKKITGAVYLERTKVLAGSFNENDLEKVSNIANIISPVVFKHIETSKLKNSAELQKRGFFVGTSKKMHEIYEQIQEVALYDFPVYFFGETGTGKELAAQCLHNLSNRKNKSFIAVNCSTIQKNLVESDFFGHEQGAFTGAVSAQKGKFELADGGTIFLDEIGELNLEIQAKLLRAVEKQEIWKVGAESPKKIDTRIVIATHKNLLAEVEKGNFREDLYHRLAFLKIEIPPLRERPEDIPVLAYHFLKKANLKTNKEIAGFTEDAVEYLLSQKWRGNVRELENAISICVLRAKKGMMIDSLCLKLFYEMRASSVTKNHNGNTIAENGFEIRNDSSQGLNEKIDALEKYEILKSLKENNYHLKNTYQALKIDNKRLDRLLAKYKIVITKLK
ncbi:sigma 54-interacting transcriptional regulator, partial [bacterium]|nr:sigma 54-interacting transcriptional regulator [bacterium]